MRRSVGGRVCYLFFRLFLLILEDEAEADAFYVRESRVHCSKIRTVLCVCRGMGSRLFIFARGQKQMEVQILCPDRLQRGVALGDTTWAYLNGFHPMPNNEHAGCCR